MSPFARSIVLAIALAGITSPVVLQAAAPPGARSSSGLWTELAEKSVLAARGASVTADSARRGAVPSEYRTLKLDRALLDFLLKAAPLEFNRRAALAAGTPAEALPPVALIDLPVAGSADFERFSVEDSPIMESGLAARYPQIRTYLLQGLDHPEHGGRLDVTPAGLHAMILSARGQTFIDPYFADGSDSSVAIAYRKADLFPTRDPMTCLVGATTAPTRDALARAETSLSKPSGATLRVYRLALAADAEYAAATGGGSVDASGTFVSAGTVLGALASMVTTVNRVDAVYERDFAIRMVLVNSTDRIIYLDPNTDPYTNDTGSTMLGQNQTTCDSVIGTANYDIGHVFSTGGGGIAGLGVVCRAGQKARGVTGSPQPTGDPYDIDYVAHEMGHQFGANHPFNSTTNACGSGNRHAATAYEPGSGTTIMAYAGICSVSGNVQDLAPNSDDYFHGISYDEIDAYTTTGAGSAVVVPSIATGNHPPTVTTTAAYNIPIKTPFALTAAGADVDGDSLTYCWEEFDLGAAVNATTIPALDNGAAAIFRSYAPTANATRFFPSLPYIVNSGNVPPLRDPVSGKLVGETLPLIARPNGLNFRCTVRDNRVGGGGSDFATVKLTVADASGPFAVTAFNSPATLAGGSTQTVTWDVAGTSATPVSCASVKISLSTDGGLTFPIVLAPSVPNSGSASVLLPNTGNVATTQGRIKVEAVGNIFFDISNADLKITSSNVAPTFAANGTALSLVRGAPNAVTATVGSVTLGSNTLTGATVSNAPDGVTLTPRIVAGNAVQLDGLAACRVTTTLSSRTYPVSITVTDAAGSTASGTVNVSILPNPSPTLGAYAATSVARNATTVVTPAAPPTDGNLPVSPFTVSPTTLPGGGTLAINQGSGGVTVTPTAASTLGVTTVRVTLQDGCGAAVIRSFDVTITAAVNVAPSITSNLPPSTAVAGNGYTHTFKAGGTPAPSFAVTAGTLPPGLTLNGASGVLSGTPTTPGVYTGITVSAGNGIAPNASQTFSITVSDSLANYAAGYGYSGADAAPAANPVGDGISNLLKYALNLPLNVRATLPNPTLKDYAGTKYLSLSFTRVPLASDVTYRVETSPDLAVWTAVATSAGGAALTGSGVVSDSGGSAPLKVEVRDTVAQDSTTPGQRRFIRLRVTQP